MSRARRVVKSVTFWSAFARVGRLAGWCLFLDLLVEVCRRKDFSVADDTQPVLGVNGVNKAGAGVEFPTVETTGLPSIMWESRRGQSRLGRGNSS